MADYKYLVEMWDAAGRRWIPDGDLAYAAGFAMRYDGTPRTLATQILRNWTGEPGNSATGRWRATVWNYDQGKPWATRQPQPSTRCSRKAER